MYKKISTFIIMFFMLSLILSPTALSNENAENESITRFGFRSIFAAYPLIYITRERPDELAIPNSGVLDININITFRLLGIFALWHERKLRNRVVEVKLSIDEKPDWCDATLTDDLVEMKIGETEPFQSSLLVTVTEQAPAFKQAKVTIRAKSNEIRGLFFIIVNEGEWTYTIPFEVGYWPVISCRLPEGNSMEIPPLNNTKIPIKLENFGNGPTRVNIEIIDIPKNWNLTYPKDIILGSPALGEENKKEIKIIVKSPKDFSRETIKISFTPSYVGKPGLQGQTEIITLTLKNDGSLEEEGFDITLLIIIVVAIILIILVSIFLKRTHLKN